MVRRSPIEGLGLSADICVVCISQSGAEPRDTIGVVETSPPANTTIRTPSTSGGRRNTRARNTPVFCTSHPEVALTNSQSPRAVLTKTLLPQSRRLALTVTKLRIGPRRRRRFRCDLLSWRIPKFRFLRHGLGSNAHEACSPDDSPANDLACPTSQALEARGEIFGVCEASAARTHWSLTELRRRRLRGSRTRPQCRAREGPRSLRDLTRMPPVCLVPTSDPVAVSGLTPASADRDPLDFKLCPDASFQAFRLGHKSLLSRPDHASERGSREALSASSQAS